MDNLNFRKKIENMNIRDLLKYKQKMLENEKWFNLSKEQQEIIENKINKEFRNACKGLKMFFDDF